MKKKATRKGSVNKKKKKNTPEALTESFQLGKRLGGCRRVCGCISVGVRNRILVLLLGKNGAVAIGIDIGNGISTAISIGICFGISCGIITGFTVTNVHIGIGVGIGVGTSIGITACCRRGMELSGISRRVGGWQR